MKPTVELLSALRPNVRPRSDWADDRSPTGPLAAEEDVRFLVVHHTASRNDYSEAEVAAEIRGFYRFHTGPEKGWPDVAYNFFVDRFGEIWEAREGSIEQPVRGDATGGSQGFAQLCCLIGDYRTAPVSQPQQQSLTRLLAWLAERYGIDTAPGSSTTFSSRGSNRWSAGTSVRAATISGHRDMSLTTCPGQVVYDLVTNELPANVSLLREAALTELNSSTNGASEPSPVPTSKPDASPNLPKLQAAPVLGSSSSGYPVGVAGGAAAVGLGGLAGLLALRTRRRRSEAKHLPTTVEASTKVNSAPD